MRLLFIEVTIMTYDKDKMRETAIKNLGGSEAMYNKYLAKFKDKYVGIADEIVSVMNAGDAEESRRLAHSVKGLAATLGLMPCSDAAFELEKLFKVAIETGFTDELMENILPALENFKEKIEEACK